MKGLNWESDIYAQGKHLNLWPFSYLVSAVLRATAGRDRRQLRVLELGCGAGNNLWFLAESGFQVWGIDLSETAIEFARKRLSSKGLAATLIADDIEKITLPEAYFDFIVDRSALTCNCFSKLARIIEIARRALKEGGTILSFDLFGVHHPGRAFGKEVEPQCYDNFRGGPLDEFGLTSFFTEGDLYKLFESFRETKVLTTRVFDGDTLVSESLEVTATK